MRRRLGQALGALLLAALATPAQAQQEVRIPDRQPPRTEESVARGKEVYAESCAFCHGAEGDGKGPVADYLYPRPRDFSLGVFKLRTTQDGDPPLDRDLYRTISRGIPGTAMPAWGSLLTEEERWQVIYYVKDFAAEFIEGIEPEVIFLGERLEPSAKAIARGAEVYQRMKCFQCHGEKGRGDGVSSADLKDDWGFKIYPFNLADGWMFKGGSRAEDIYMRFTTGVNGTPMPSFALSLTEEERWQLAHYVRSLTRDEGPGSDVVVEARLVPGAIPSDPDDEVWQESPALAIPLAGQVITKPRWQNHSISTVYVSAVYNGEEIAFRVEWDDRSRDVTHDSTAVDVAALMEDTYVPASLLFEEKRMRDALCLQFPVKTPEGPDKPHFFWGEVGKKVNLWKWHADWAEAGRAAVLEMNGTGYRSPLQTQPDSSQTTRSSSTWSDGVWRLVVRRATTTQDKANDVQFTPGALIPLAVQAWDGSRGETDKIMALSAWAYVRLETPRRLAAYAYGLLGMGLAVAVEAWLLRRTRRTGTPETGGVS